MKKIISLLILGFSLAFCEDILLLSVYKEKDFKDKNLSSYLMSEKFDGVRGIWNGKEFKTRQGNLIKTPPFFTQNFPNFALDGELWIARAKFDEISALVRTNDSNESLWQKVSYKVFDVPNACEEFKLYPCTLKNRLKVLEQYLQTNSSSYIQIIPQIPIKDKKHLKDFYENIIKNQGEGVVIRKNNAPYERFRSKEALKLKPYNDAECQVIGYTQGKGKFQGLVGSLICKMPNNKIIKIGSGLKLKDRQNPPKIGSIITYKFNKLTKNGLPRFPVFLRVRDENS